MKIHFLFITLLFLITSNVTAKNLVVKITDSETGDAVQFASIYAIHSNKGGLSDENGIIQLSEINMNDSLVILNVGYQKTIVRYDEKEQNGDTLFIKLFEKPYAINEIEIYPKKGKLQRKGKKHSSGMFRITQKVNRGECHAWEIGRKGHRNWLVSVSIYNDIDVDNNPNKLISDTLSNKIRSLSHMRMRINVYDASERGKSNSIERWNYQITNTEPIIFTYEKNKSEDNLWVYKLPEPLLLPENALVEVEFLDDMSANEFVIYRSNIFGKGLLYRTVNDAKWLKLNVCTPLSLEILEEKL